MRLPYILLAPIVNSPDMVPDLEKSKLFDALHPINPQFFQYDLHILPQFGGRSCPSRLDGGRAAFPNTRESRDRLNFGCFCGRFSVPV